MDEKKIFLRKSFFSFFIPSVCSTVALAVGGLADCIFVGSQVGAEGLTIIGFGAPVYQLYSLISIGISTGTSIHYSKVMGDGDVKKGKDLFHNTLLFVFLILIMVSMLGLVFMPQVMKLLGAGEGSEVYDSLKQYLTVMFCTTPVMFLQAPFYYFVHCDNNPKLAATALVSANITDILVNYLLIVILKTGVVGSVYSTVCGAFVTIFICQIHLLSKKTSLSYGRFQICFRYIWQGIRTGYATNAQYAYQFVVLLVFNQLMMQVQGESGVACLDVAVNIASVILAVMVGISMTLQPMIATFFGERNRSNIKNTMGYAFLYGGAVYAGFLLLICFFAPVYCPVFGMKSGILLAQGVWAIRIYMLSMTVKFVNSVMACYYQTIGKERLSYVMLFLSEALGLLLFGNLFAKDGFYNFWWCYLASEILTVLVLGIDCLCKKSFLFLNFEEAVFTAFLCSRERDITEIMGQIQEFCREQGAEPRQSYFITLVVEEVSYTIFQQQSAQDVYIQMTLVRETKEDFVLHLRDNYKEEFTPFDINTDNLMQEAEDENAIGMRLVKQKAKEFFYRQYSGFNTLVIRL